MIKRTLFAGLIIFSFLIASMNFAVATYSETITDESGDVIDYSTGESVSDKGYIDIKELFCSREYRKVTLKLTAEDAIKNEGNILIYRLSIDEEFYQEYTKDMTEEELTEIFEEMLMQDIVQYSFEIITSDDGYTIIYVNNEVLILDGESNLIEGSNSVSDNIITVSFNLPSSKENLTEVAATAEEYSNAGETYAYDDLYGEIDDPLTSNGNSDNGGSGDDDNGSPGFELITILFAIVIGIILLRKKRTG